MVGVFGTQRTYPSPVVNDKILILKVYIQINNALPLTHLIDSKVGKGSHMEFTWTNSRGALATKSSKCALIHR